MLIIADQRIPGQARKELQTYGSVLWLKPQKMAYEAISAHPDIFFCRAGRKLIVAPNLSKDTKTQLKEFQINFSEGAQIVGSHYPETARYNVVITQKFLIGNTLLMEKTIPDAAKKREIIHVNQGYTRCNLVALPGDRFITSDKGIEKKLVQHGLKVLFVEPAGILLPGFKNGFIGGTCGVWQDKLFFTGHLNHFPKGHNIREFVPDMEVIELYDGPLFDGGGIIFI